MQKLIEIESKLINILFLMKNKGTPVLEKKFREYAPKAINQITFDIANFKKETAIDIFASKSIENYCNKNKILFPKTEKGNASFLGNWLQNHENLILKKIADLRKSHKNISTFFEKNIDKYLFGGRLYPTFKSTKMSDSKGTYGTVSGRFSCSNPNIQQFPAEARKFLGEEGKYWISLDYSQIELRIFAHYVNNTIMLDAYKENLDLHQVMADILGIERKKAKNITFGIIYGMGVATMAKNLGVSFEEAKDFRDMYYSKFPEIKYFSDYAKKIAENRGYVKTFLGRKRHFDTYLTQDNTFFENEEEAKEHANYLYQNNLATFNSYQKYGTYRALNSIIQGSAADLFKKALVEIGDLYYESGDSDFIPVNLVHDEFCFVSQNVEKFKKVKNIMENALKFKVPLSVDVEIGENWGDATNKYLFQGE